MNREVNTEPHSNLILFIQAASSAKNSPEFKIRKDVKLSMHFCVRFFGMGGKVLKNYKNV